MNAALALNRLANRGDGLLHLPECDRLDAVAKNAVLQRLLRIVKVFEAADENKFFLSVCLLHLPRQLDSVHAGHFDVAKDQIDRMRLQPRQRTFAILKGTHQRKAGLFPWKVLGDVVDGVHIVIDHNQSVHRTSSPFLAQRIVMCGIAAAQSRLTLLSKGFRFSPQSENHLLAFLRPLVPNSWPASGRKPARRKRRLPRPHFLRKRRARNRLPTPPRVRA